MRWSLLLRHPDLLLPVNAATWADSHHNPSNLRTVDRASLKSRKVISVSNSNTNNNICGGGQSNNLRPVELKSLNLPSEDGSLVYRRKSSGSTPYTDSLLNNMMKPSLSPSPSFLQCRTSNYGGNLFVSGLAIPTPAATPTTTLPIANKAFSNTNTNGTPTTITATITATKAIMTAASSIITNRKQVLSGSPNDKIDDGHCSTIGPMVIVR